MDRFIELCNKIIPEANDILIKRYDLLKSIYYNQPIGRRTLSNKLHIPERTVRREINFLKEQKLIQIQSIGMNITEEGRLIIDELKDFMHKIRGINRLEEMLKEKLNIKKVIIIHGDYTKNKAVINEVGRFASDYIKNIVKDNQIIGVTGGTTMSKVAEEMARIKIKSDVMVIPARGSVGKYLETQASNIAAKMANALGGSYKLLHAPDNIEKETIDALMQVEEIKELIEVLKKMDTLVFGLGRADVMAKRRRLSENTVNKLINDGAVAEAFGYYFDKEGKILKESKTIGLTLDDFLKVKNVIGVACGLSKAEAIMSICSLRDDIVLVIDEGVAKKILGIYD